MLSRVLGPLAAWILLFAPVAPGAAWAAEIRVGILAFRGAERALEQWEPTLAHLAAALPGDTVRAVPLDLAGLTQAVAGRQVDFVLTNPGHYVELEAAHGIARIATFATRDGPPPSAALGAAAVVPSGSAIVTLADLEDKRVAAVMPEAFGGFRVLARELAARGIDAFDGGIAPVFVGFPMENALAAVERGEADAAILRGCLLEDLVADGRVAAGAYRVVEGRPAMGERCRVSTALYPEWPFARLQSTPPDMAKTVGIALLSMPDGGGQGWTVPVDYQKVHDLFADLRIGPYEHLRRRTLGEILRPYWPWLAAMVLAGIWWVVHVARVEQLVRRRTDELREAHEEVRRRREELEHASRLALMGEMASSLAHEINQPLAAISNYAKGCQRRLAANADPEGVAEGLTLIHAQAERAAAIVRRVRGFVRKRPPEALDLDVNEAVEEALALFQGVARRGLKIRTELAAGLPPVRADRVQIEQVVVNLLQNGLDAMAGMAARRLSVTTRVVDGAVEVAVADRGRGLSADDRERMFDPFFSTKREGLGLGLALSRSIVEAHGGRLWAEDGEEGGAVFRFTIPVRAEASP